MVEKVVKKAPEDVPKAETPAIAAKPAWSIFKRFRAGEDADKRRARRLDALVTKEHKARAEAKWWERRELSKPLLYATCAVAWACTTAAAITGWASGFANWMMNAILIAEVAMTVWITAVTGSAAYPAKKYANEVKDWISR